MTTRSHPIEAEELMAYLDGELAPDKAIAAATHLETCMECQQLAADLRGVSQALNTWDLQPTTSTMPTSLAAVVEEHIFELQPALAIPLRWYRRLRFRSWAPAFAGCAFVVTLVVGLLSRFEVRLHQEVASAPRADYDSSTVQPAPMASPSSSRGAEGVIGGIVPAPPASPGKNFDRLAQFSKLQAPPSAKFQGQNIADVPAQVGHGSGSGRTERSADLLPTGPMIIRTAELSLTTRDFDKGRAQVEDILKRHHGYVGMLNVTNVGAGRVLTASLRIPSAQLDAALSELKALGRLVSESKNGQEITAQYVDLQARLANSRTTEKRLIDLLQDRTGKLSDVLEVENELARVRGEVESMEAERKNLSNQVDFATLNLTLTEDYRAQLQVVPPSSSTRLINAAVEGYRSMVDGLMAVALFFLSSGPSLLLWAAILFLPARFMWKRLRRNLSGANS